MAEYRDIEELLIWAFGPQQVERYVRTLRGGSVGPASAPQSSEDAMRQILLLGTRVDSSSAGALWAGARCHDDAVTIYEAVMALPAEAWVEVIKHARSGERPYWYPDGPGRWVTPRDKWGQPKRLWRDPVRQRGDLGEAPPELLGIDPAMVEEARATYRLWHTALCELVGLVNRDLVSWRARWPAASPEPWLDPVGAHIEAG
ncbi:hypothetical protein [Devosia ginsengisoli]|uniref:hypothetical protein n=1 Tax=Devosia ginsengisoli TaxID=400770 RepID=UPI0026E94557|nr:hypothetical protein [Devosia ginsengisoli]MCR6672187.1 hypothetical protein [Devosia ginsengisoli]